MNFSPNQSEPLDHVKSEEREQTAMQFDALLNASQDRTRWSQPGTLFVVMILIALVGVSLQPLRNDRNSRLSSASGLENALSKNVLRAQNVSKGSTTIFVIDANGNAVNDGELEVNVETYRCSFFASKLPIREGKATIEWQDRELKAFTFMIKSPGRMSHFKKYARKEGDSFLAPSASYGFQLSPGISIGGKITDEDGRPVANAKVCAYCPAIEPDETGIDVFEQTITTDTEGMWEASAAPLNLLQLKLKIMGPGIFKTESDRDVTPQEQEALKSKTDVRTLRIPAMTNATVVDPEGNPIEGAQVIFAGREPLDDDARNLILKTDATGSFPIANLPEGSQIITIFSPDWAPLTVRVEYPLTDLLRITIQRRVRCLAIDEYGVPVGNFAFAPEALPDQASDSMP